ncbi:MAG: hypothetical protein AABZ61_11200 [Bacteroidota bacterium]
MKITRETHSFCGKRPRKNFYVERSSYHKLCARLRTTLSLEFSNLQTGLDLEDVQAYLVGVVTSVWSYRERKG